MPLPSESRSEPRFLFVTGKGGTGKTTVAAALARAHAAQGKRVLVALCNTKERLSSLLGCGPIGADIAPAGERIWAVNIEPERSLEEYGQLILKVRALTRAIFDNRYVKSFFRAVPGLYEWSMLGKAWHHTTETSSDGRKRFDLVILDAPATGHGLDMLRVPKVILDVVPPGVLRRDAETAWQMFRDPKQSGVVVVTLAEEMPATESCELVATLQGELGLPVHLLVVNGVLPPLFTPEERAAFAAHPELILPGTDLRAEGAEEKALLAGARRAARERVQASSLEKLRASLKLPQVVLPFLFQDATGPKGVDVLASRLGEALSSSRAAGP